MRSSAAVGPIGQTRELGPGGTRRWARCHDPRGAPGSSLALFAALTRGAAAQPVDPAPTAGANDLGGVVTERQRPGSRRLGDRGDHRPADQVRQDRRHRRSGPLRHSRSAEGELQRLGARLRPGRLAEGRSRARQDRSISSAVVAPNAAAAARILSRRSTGTRCSRFRRRASSRHGPRGNGMPANMKSQAQWLDIVKTNGCYACHQLGNKATRTIPKELGDLPTSSVEAWERRIQSGQAMTQMTASIGRLDTQRALDAVRRLDRPHRRRRTAASQAAAAARRRAQRRRHAVGLGRPEGLPARRDLDRQAQPARQRQRAVYGAPEESTDFVPVLDPVHHTAIAAAASGARSEDAVRRRTHPMAPSPYWGDEPIWDSQTSIHNPMFDEKGRVWFTSRVRPPDEPGLLQEGLGPSVGEAVPARTRPNRHLSMYDPKTQQVHADQHLLPDAPSVLRRGREPHAVDQRRRAGERRGRLAQPQDVRGDRRRAEVARLDAAHPRHQRQRQARRVCRAEPAGRSDKDKRIDAALYGVAVSPVDGSVWGIGRSASRAAIVRARSRGRIRPRPRWPKSTSRRSTRATAPRGMRHRPQRRRAGRRSRAAISRASTAASARARSTARPRPASTAPKAGRSIRSPGRNSRA